MNLVEFQQKFYSEQVCLDYLENARWGKEITCPHCGTIGKTYKYSNGKMYRCGACRKQFTAKVGTIFSDSKIPQYKWFLAIYLATSLKKGISSVQLSKYIGVTQKSAWFMLQRIRFALEKSGNGFMLQNEVEVDETYLGPNPKKRTTANPRNKQIVFGMGDRNGKAILKHVDKAGKQLIPIIEQSLAPITKVYSDSYQAYRALYWKGWNHQAVNHMLNERVRVEVHTQNIENIWSHMKRGINCIYIQVSVKHLQMYCNEYAYRYCTKDMTDIERFSDWFSHSLCRLTYKELINDRRTI